MELTSLLGFIILAGLSLHKILGRKSNYQNSEKKNLKVNSSISVNINERDLTENISGYFVKNNLRYWISEDRKSFRTGFNLGGEGCYDLLIGIHENHLTFMCEVLTEVEDNFIARTLDIVSRINQYYNFGHLNFFFEERLIAFKIVYPLFQNELNEDKFEMFINGVLDGARKCRPIIEKVLLEGEEPAIAVMSI